MFCYKTWGDAREVASSSLFSPPQSSRVQLPRLYPFPTMSNIANEKGSINYSNNIGDEHHHGSGGNAASALPAHTYVHNTAPQLRVLGNPGPL